MAIYHRNNIPFAEGIVSVFAMDTLPMLTDPGKLLTPLQSSSGTQLDLSLSDGTILRFYGSWTASGDFIRTGSGTITGFERLSAEAQVLELGSDFSLPFSISFNFLTSENFIHFPTLPEIAAAADSVYGGNLDDLLRGYDGNDTLNGTLNGNAGDNTMIGGLGNDR